ncbi:hypothetical protein HGRIS_010322 [Hohenbuehelia grisea]|uniref:F-box domain-containing protein n=1 Tax=Hohenbuehelia grisea TaxID=104357 RepID=A0ABR3J3Y8_9AGAR
MGAATSRSFASYPTELVVYVLTLLDAEDLLDCRLICKRFQELIDFEVKLQYKIALFEACQEDCPSSSLGTSAKLETLRAHQKAWSTLDWSDSREFERADDEGRLRLSGNLLTNINDAGTHIRFRQLPSAIRGIPWKEWTLTDFGLQDFEYFVNASQDLLVLMERPTEGRTHRIYLRKASDGLDHPSATLTTLVHTTTGFYTDPIQNWDYIPSMEGPILGIKIEGDLEIEFVFWNWHTGEKKLHKEMGGFVRHLILDEQHVMFAWFTLGDSGCYLNIHELSATNLDNVESHASDVDSYYRCALEFPETHDLTRLTNIDFAHSTDSSMAYHSDTGVMVHPPFSANHGHDSIVLDLDRERGNLALVIPCTTFYKALDAVRASSRSRLDIPWEQWGPRGAFYSKPPAQWTSICTFGTRCLWLDCDTGTIELVDFNPYAARRSQHTQPSDREAAARDAMFFHDMVAESIPNRAHHRLISSPDRMDWGGTGVLMGEDSIVILDNDTFRLLTF